MSWVRTLHPPMRYHPPMSPHLLLVLLLILASACAPACALSTSSDAVAAELEEAWTQSAQGWGEEVQFAYASALAEEEEALLSWVESTWPTAP